jgi:hypothetical protein
MDKAKYMVLLRNPIDESLKALLSGYIVNQSGLEFIFCSEWEQNGVFVYIKAANYQKHQQWGINIPLSSVLSVADFSEERNFDFTTQRVHQPI